MSGLPQAIGFGILTVVMLYFAVRANYFAFLKAKIHWEFPIQWYHVVTVFSIYFATVIFVVPLISEALHPLLSSSPQIAVATWLNFLASFLILIAVVIYCSVIPRNIARNIWRRSDQSALFQDVRVAALTFIIAFPLVIFLNEVFDLLLSHFFQMRELPDQLAVRFLKMTFDHPQYFFLSIVTIVAFAPMLEELLFRGFLQSLIRQHLGSKSAIFLTALCFACFHYSPEQGLSNISIIGSLFALALFLGIVYEKQGSLLASMTLHALFNSISVLNLYFVGGFPKAL